jgi:hypothetical protein
MATWSTEPVYLVNVEGMVVEALDESWSGPENMLTAGCCFTKGLSSWPQSHQSPVTQSLPTRHCKG